jgi:hypothetical protein
VPKLKQVVIGILIAFIVIIVAIGACVGRALFPNTLVEIATGTSPQARVCAYVQAIDRGDEQAALDLWELSDRLSDPESTPLGERRQKITRELLETRLAPGFMILDSEWWSTCCEPREIPYFIYSVGAVHMKVRLRDTQGHSLVYMFDLFARELPWNEDPRDWVIRDIYPSDQEPLFFSRQWNHPK